MCHGDFPIAESGHTLLLGWNATTLPTLRQIEIARGGGAGARGALGAPVVVLAERDKTAMDREARSPEGGGLWGGGGRGV